MAIDAIAFRIVVKPAPIQEKKLTFGSDKVPVTKIKGRWVTESGVDVTHLVDEQSEQGAAVRGTIVSIGEDAWQAYKPKSEFAGLKVGDDVFYARYAGKVVRETDDSEELLVLNDEDIVCKVTKEVK